MNDASKYTYMYMYKVLHTQTLKFRKMMTLFPMKQMFVISHMVWITLNRLMSRLDKVFTVMLGLHSVIYIHPCMPLHCSDSRPASAECAHESNKESNICDLDSVDFRGETEDSKGLDMNFRQNVHVYSGFCTVCSTSSACLQQVIGHLIFCNQCHHYVNM